MRYASSGLLNVFANPDSVRVLPKEACAPLLPCPLFNRFFDKALKSTINAGGDMVPGADNEQATTGAPALGERAAPRALPMSAPPSFAFPNPTLAPHDAMNQCHRTATTYTLTRTCLHLL